MGFIYLLFQFVAFICGILGTFRFYRIISVFHHYIRVCYYCQKFYGNFLWISTRGLLNYFFKGIPLITIIIISHIIRISLLLNDYCHDIPVYSFEKSNYYIVNIIIGSYYYEILLNLLDF